MLSIVLVTWELSEDSQFPLIETDLLEAAKFASLWATKDVDRVRESKVFWVLMEVSIRTTINQKPWFSPTVFEQLSGYTKFKVDFHHVYIRARKDLDQKWYDIPYLATDDAIVKVLKHWPTDWHTSLDLATRTSKSSEKQKKEAARLKV